MRSIDFKESGYTIVEATIVYPVTVMLFFVILYASLFLCQRANLQAKLEDALIYYKNEATDTFVSANESMIITKENELIKIAGNSYEVESSINPYRHIGAALGNAIGINGNQDKFSKLFHSRYGTMFFDDGENIKVEVISVTDAILYRKITVRATQQVSAPINLAFVGAENSMTLSAEATAIMVDGDDLIRDFDFAVDLVENTKVGKKAKELAGKAMEYYEKLKEKF